MREGLSKALAVEFIGTFTLIFVGAGAVALGSGGVLGAAFAHGMVVAALAYAYGHISGTHVNPAVTIAIWVAGKIDARRAVSYIVFQLAGGIAGGLALRWVLGGTETGLGATVLARGLRVGEASIDISPAAGCALEAVLTFFLVNTVLNTSTAGRLREAAGLAIGLTLAFCTLMGAPLTGAGLNPARTLGPALAGGGFADFWVYLAGPILGGILAAVFYRGVLKPR